MFDKGWATFIAKQINEEYFPPLAATIQHQRNAGAKIYPPEGDVFKALKLTPFADLKAVIIGQDPYHVEGLATGLAFSVPDGAKIPSTLNNIFRELHRDLGVPKPTSGNLEGWSSKGVLLLNSVLTVSSGKAGSHRGLGWEKFTDNLVSYTSENKEGIVFALWGADAQKKAPLIDRKKHTILKTSHPSSFSAHQGFFGCGHFKKINEACNIWDVKGATL